jgi:MFS family permease
MLILGFPLGFFISGNFSGFGSYLAELFPSRMRGSGQGFVYNTGRGLGAFAPPLVGYLGDHPPAWFDQLAWVVSEPLALSIMVVSVLACGLAMFTLIFLPETKGKELQAFH